MAKLPIITVKVVRLEDGEYTLDELVVEIARKLEQMSRDGSFRIHEKGVVSDMLGIRADA